MLCPLKPRGKRGVGNNGKMIPYLLLWQKIDYSDIQSNKSEKTVVMFS